MGIESRRRNRLPGGADGLAVAGAQPAIIAAHSGEKAGLRFANQRLGLVIGGKGGGDVLVIDFDLACQPVQRPVAIDRPLAPAIDAIGGGRLFPAFQFLVLRRNGRLDALIFWSDSAGGQREDR